MIPKTQAEKEHLKRAKKEAKEADRIYKAKTLEIQNKLPPMKRVIERYGVMNTETELPNDYPVYYDYLYVIDDKLTSGLVVRSNIQATVLQLKRDLAKRGYEFERVYTCDLSARGIY